VKDIQTIKPRQFRELVPERVDVIVASPPCEGFSTIGQRARKEKARKENREFSEYADARNHHFEDVIAWARVLRPAFVVMENVTAIRHVRHRQRTFLDEAAHRLSRLGYVSRQWVLNAAAFGVPQERVRCFLVATRLPLFPPAPVRDYRDSSAGDHDVDALPAVTLMEAIADLPALKHADGSPVARWAPPHPEIAKWCRRYLTRCGILNSPRLLFNHRSRYQNESDLRLFAALRPGENSVDAIRRHGLVELMRYRRDAFDDKYYRLPPDRPCRTIVSHLAKDGNSFIHPVQVRNLTVREAARVQGFPDDHPFCGAFSEQFAQVGDAVPPPVARAIAESLREVLLRVGGKARKP
jgi:DNA (cytosine-5)-methyltransferase 1